MFCRLFLSLPLDRPAPDVLAPRPFESHPVKDGLSGCLSVCAASLRPFAGSFPPCFALLLCFCDLNLRRRCSAKALVRAAQQRAGACQCSTQSVCTQMSDAAPTVPPPAVAAPCTQSICCVAFISLSSSRRMRLLHHQAAIKQPHQRVSPAP